MNSKKGWLSVLIPLVTLLFLSTFSIIYQVKLEARDYAASYLPVLINRPFQTQLGLHVSIWKWDETIEKDLALAATTEAKIVRIPISWHLLQEYGPDSYVPWYEDTIRELVIDAESHGFDILFMMSDPPAWAVDTNETYCGAGRHPLCNVTDPIKYAEAVLHVLDIVTAASKGNVQIFFEVWNEPNFYWDPVAKKSLVPMTAVDYTNLLKTTYQRVKPYHPSVSILGGALAGTPVSYLNSMYAAGAKGHYDILSIHPYTEGNTLPPNDCDDEDINLDWSYCQGIERIHETMGKHGDQALLWFTEFGFSSYPQPTGVDKVKQKAYMGQAIQLINERNWSFVGATFWYNLRDCTDIDPRACTPPPSTADHYFGLFNFEGTPKPVSTAFTFSQSPIIPSVTPSPSATPFLLTVPGDLNIGETWKVPEAGTYSFSIISGVYSPWESDSYPDNQWRSIIYIYRNRPIDWVQRQWGLEPGNPDYQIGNWEIPGESKADAEARAVGTYKDLSLVQDDILTLVAVDVKDSYNGNRGGVNFNISTQSLNN